MIANYKTSSGDIVSMVTIADLWAYAESRHGGSDDDGFGNRNGLWLGMDGHNVIILKYGYRVDTLVRIDLDLDDDDDLAPLYERKRQVI